MTDLPTADTAALSRLPRCACGAPSMALRPGTEPEPPILGIALDRGEPGTAWCAACWPWRPVARQLAEPAP